jgi:methylmalonyl-CoA mutase
VLKIDNTHVRNQQINRLKEVKAKRNEEACQASLKALTEAASKGEGNLLQLSVEAARLRATVGEISFALEQIYGRHVAKDSIVRGAYSKESTDNTGE